MFVAVIGCGHGEIDRIYEVVSSIEATRGIKVSLVLCCGDFQSVRNMTDLRCMACPIKYQQMHDFHRYYSGNKVAPIPTIFIGGNHEASNYLQELPYGGWVAPNIYFLSSGVIKFGSIRIAGISGIFKGKDYLKGKYESPPYNQDSMRSVYHYRNLDIFRMKQVTGQIDIMISHDWPKNIHVYGDTQQLLRRKPFFREEIERDELGSRPLSELLHHLQPSHWFSAHMHVKFAAVVPHVKCSTTDEETTDNLQQPVGPTKVTKFLALDKILPRRQFLQIIEVADDKTNEEPQLHYDAEWLAILKSTNDLLSVKPNTCFMPGPSAAQAQTRYDFIPTKEEIEEICVIFDRKLNIPDTFSQTAPPYENGEHPGTAFPIENPQTVAFCEKLGVSDPLSLLGSYANGIGFEQNQSGNSRTSVPFHHYDIRNDAFSEKPPTTPQSTSYTQPSHNPDEISLDDDDEEINFSPSPSFSQRRKLELPPPKSSIDVSNSDDSKDKLHLLESIFDSNSTTQPDPPISVEENSLFVIDRIGEPQLKRRNINLYRTDSNSE